MSMQVTLVNDGPVTIVLDARTGTGVGDEPRLAPTEA